MGTPNPKPKSKKPYHIKRADLHLEEYKKERSDRSPQVLFNRALNALKASRQFHFYVGLQLLASISGYGQVMLAVGLLWAMIANTGKRKEGEMSAYSLFNEGFEAIEGSTDMEALERELRVRGA
ncbi:MAG: hypothetical protein M1835_001603 [Candelina submexicana]|nr:MAG: hypothetical protein M1835_001603 [Candelina submexicana]